jgi:shikimate dehydrogenase
MRHDIETKHRVLIGLIGANIMKSLSPAMHEDALTAAKVTGHYHLMDLDRLPDRKLGHVVAGARALGMAGFNVTFPVKQAILPLLDEIAGDALQVGAVNTVVIDESGRLIGHNTDRSGFRRSVVEELGPEAVNGNRVLLVGAGGAGRAVAFALMDLGAGHVAIHDIDPSKATATVADLVQHFGGERCSYAPDAAAALSGSAGLVNCTPIGMLGFEGIPCGEAVKTLAPHQFVADIIYTPIQTELIRLAAAKGCRTLTGGGMCVHQAADAFRLFTGIEPDIVRMKGTFLRALATRDAALRNAA